MKQIGLLLLTLLSGPVLTIAQPQVRVTINAATVFLNGAELSGTAKVTLPQGESDVIFTNVAGSVNQQSLSIGAENGVVIQSATFQNNYLADSMLSPRGKKLQDSIRALEHDVVILADKKTVVEEQLAVLKENKKVAGQNNGLSVAELQKLLDLMSTRMNGLLASQRTLGTEIDQKNERVALLTSQLNEEQEKNYQPGGQLLVKFYAPEATTSDIRMTYVVPNAGWSPSYDLRVAKVNSPVQLFYKANVYQNCGVKWNNIKLSLSTGNPNEGVDAPVLNPKYLSFYALPPLVNFRKPGGSREIEKAPTTNLSDVASLSTQAYQSRNSANISPGGGRSTGEQYVIDGYTVGKSGMDQYASVDNSGVNTSFDIELPYTIPSDGQQHTVSVKTYELPASYRYISVPKIDRDAFLQAQVTNWEDLNLLPAQTNVFFEGSYIGQGYIDMRNVRDTMNFSLGRDKKIIVRRERDKDLHSKKVIGANERQSFTYSISVRNTRKEKINLVVLDQIPVSNDADIVVEDKAYEKAVYDDQDGTLRWILDVKPAELQKVSLSYTVKYPKGKTVNNLK